MICWSCQKEAGAEPLCVACGALQPPEDKADLFAVLGLRPRYAVDLTAAEAAYKDLSRQVHPDRYATGDPRAAPRVAGAHGPAQSGLAHDQGSGAARGVPAHAGGHRHRRQAAGPR